MKILQGKDDFDDLQLELPVIIIEPKDTVTDVLNLLISQTSTEEVLITLQQIIEYE